MFDVVLSVARGAGALDRLLFALRTTVGASEIAALELLAPSACQRNFAQSRIS